MRILFYCQSSLSIAPYLRTLKISQALLDVASIDYIRSYNLYDMKMPASNFKYINLPSFVTNPSTYDYTLPEGVETLEEMFNIRSQSWINNLQNPYDCFVTDLFPFSGFLFENEILNIYQHLKKANQKCALVCSLRDIPDQKKYPEELKTLKIVLQYYDRILIHADPSIVTLYDYWSFASLVKNKIFYTGYIPNGHLSQSNVERD